MMLTSVMDDQSSAMNLNEIAFDADDGNLVDHFDMTIAPNNTD